MSTGCWSDPGIPAAAQLLTPQPTCWLQQVRGILILSDTCVSDYQPISMLHTGTGRTGVYCMVNLAFYETYTVGKIEAQLYWACVMPMLNTRSLAVIHNF